MGVLTAMTLILFAGKAFGFIMWSWWIVLAPLMLEIAIITLIGMFGLAFIGKRFKR